MNLHARRTLCLLLIALLPLLSSCESRPTGPTLWLVGLDGADWDLLNPMIEAGLLPNIGRLAEEGAVGRLRAEPPLLSPILWTSIATGQTADVHQVTWFMTEGPDGQKIPISSRNRNVRALWNIASERKVRSGVIGWWATWPVEPIDGVIVSDYVGWHSFGVTGEQLDVPGKVWPAEYQRVVTELAQDPNEVELPLLQNMIHLPAEDLMPSAAAGPFGGPIAHLRQAVATTRLHTDVALDLVESESPRLLAVYYEGTDAVMHLFSRFMPPQLDWISDEDFAVHRDAVINYWRWQDQEIGKLLAVRDENTIVMLVSDHGFRMGDERLREDDFSIEAADASHMPDGIVVLHGPGIQPGQRLRGADVYDVTPTALHLLGLPVARDMAGAPLTDALTAVWRREHPVEFVETFETGPWDRGDDMVIDPVAGKNMEEMLRSLGYITGGEADSDGGGVSGGAENSINMATVLRRQGRFDEAASMLEDVLATRPRHFEARLNLAQVLAAQGKYDEALALYGELVTESPEDLELREDLALAYGHAGRNSEALEVLQRGLELDPTWATGWAHLGFAQVQLGRFDDAESSLDRALDLDPRSSIAYYGRGVLYQRQQKFEDSMTALQRALDLDPLHEESRLLLAQTMEQGGLSGEARGLLLQGLDLLGDTPDVLANLGAMEMRNQRVEAAQAYFERAVKLSPNDPLILGNLGMTEAMQGNMPGAISRFERIIEIDPNNAMAYAQLGLFLNASGDRARAQQMIQRAKQLDPELQLPGGPGGQ